MFFHGYLSSKEAFQAQIAYFSKFFRVTAFDFIGFGGSGRLTSAFSVEEYALWTKAVLSALQVEKPCVVAHSFGCRVAVKMASIFPDFFDKMVLTGAAGVVLNRGILYKIKVGAYRIVKRIAPCFAEKRFGSAEYRTLSPIMKESYKKIVNEDLRACAMRVQNPVLLVQGKEDRVTTKKEAEAYQRAFPRVTLNYIEGGHFAFAERPPLFNLMVEEFLYG